VSEKKVYSFPQYKPDHPSFAILREWWRELENDRGGRAALRRAASLTEVMLCPAFHRLLNDLRQASCAVPESRYPKLATIAGLAARVRAEIDDGLAKRMGAPKSGGDKAAVSELRIRRVLACDDLEELYTLLRRALALLDDRANLADLAAVVWHWTPMDEKSPYDPRRRMAYEYYAEAPLQ
jgi:CRISPR system Cascade subunit CasB